MCPESLSGYLEGLLRVTNGHPPSAEDVQRVIDQVNQLSSQRRLYGQCSNHSVSCRSRDARSGQNNGISPARMVSLNVAWSLSGFPGHAVIYQRVTPNRGRLPTADSMFCWVILPISDLPLTFVGVALDLIFKLKI